MSSTFPSLLLSFIGHQLPHWWHWGEGGGARDGEAEPVELVMMAMVVMEVMMCMQERTGIYIGEIMGEISLLDLSDTLEEGGPGGRGGEQERLRRQLSRRGPLSAHRCSRVASRCRFSST